MICCDVVLTTLVGLFSSLILYEIDFLVSLIISRKGGQSHNLSVAWELSLLAEGVDNL